MNVEKLVTIVGCTIACVAGLSGCGGKPQHALPTTYPLEGELTVSGKKPPAGTIVTFEPKSLDLRVQGVVNADGKFSAYMIYRGERLAGATSGPHRVAVVVPIGTDRGGGDRIMLPKEVIVEEKPNHISLAVD